LPLNCCGDDLQSIANLSRCGCEARPVVDIFTKRDNLHCLWLVDEDADPLTAEYAVVEKSAVIRWGRRGPTVGVKVTYEEIEAQSPNSYYDGWARVSAFMTGYLTSSATSPRQPLEALACDRPDLRRGPNCK
jgi:hypothetical protein